MPINFTKAIVGQLQREIADLDNQAGVLKQKQHKAQAKIKQLQRDMKLSQSSSDLSSKLSRVNKHNEEIKTATRALADLAKQITAKKTALEQHLSKAARREES
ncbi:hypothetical protein GZH47_20050 [Paenibacillus rhizovicinus]|uniref:Uncharacterized protein n=1 Tax=Paenibacillus rhizovicinus TaxID=2704463 RepID=A0A6C0P2W8_9BACL|nr:hypothetical protein [Paenibacillus rhizovicinus]QHW32874.1 hypothetical protein GZH47_20050 [Paenibacillus rhizovicinus]